MKKSEAFENPDHKYNGSEYHTGLYCIEEGCFNSAGTRWSPYWCFEHNVERIKRIDKSMKAMKAQFKKEEEDFLIDEQTAF